MIWLHWYDVVLSGILNVFSLYVDVRFLRLFFKGEKHSYNTIIFTIVWLVNWFAYFYIESFWLTIITSVIGIFVIASFFYEGIGLTNITIDPHFEIENEIQVKEDRKMSFEHVIYGVPNSSCIRINNNKVEMIGKVYEFNNGNMVEHN